MGKILAIIPAVTASLIVILMCLIIPTYESIDIHTNAGRRTNRKSKCCVVFCERTHQTFFMCALLFNCAFLRVATEVGS